jgi:hypothetical protein
MFQDTTSFFEGMNAVADVEEWASVGLNAVHCVITMNDALLAKKRGILCASKNHLDAVDLLKQNISARGIKEALTHLRKTIALKNTIEYEAKLFTLKMGNTIKNHATKFYNWALKTMQIEY